METHKHIVNRVRPAPDRQPDELRDADVEILDAWLWPSTELAERPVDEPVAIEVSLLPPTRRLLREFPVPGLERPYLRHLEQRIARNPRDLLSHVRRLYLASALDDTDAIIGALADLFLVLGRHGRQLRCRLLGHVAAQLTTEQFGFFEEHLERGLDGNETIPETSQSRLSKRVEGTTRIVTRAGDTAPGPDDPVKLARDSIANGHPDVAQAVLEGALELDPGNREVSEALLELYGERDLRGSFYKTYTTLLGRELACRGRWDALADKYRIRVGA